MHPQAPPQAPQQPHLLGGSPAPTAAQLRKKREDESIRSTDGDALGSRVSALKAGYFSASSSSSSSSSSAAALSSSSRDDFSELFYSAPPPALGPGGAPLNVAIAGPPLVRRPPIINIGTYLRCVALDRFVEAFLLAGGNAAEGRGVQIVSVGAGSDARYWRLVVSTWRWRTGRALAA